MHASVGMDVTRDVVTWEHRPVAVDAVDPVRPRERYDRVAPRHPDLEEQEREADAGRTAPLGHLEDEPPGHLVGGRGAAARGELVPAVLEECDRGRSFTKRPSGIALGPMAAERAVPIELAVRDRHDVLAGEHRESLHPGRTSDVADDVVGDEAVDDVHGPLAAREHALEQPKGLERSVGTGAAVANVEIRTERLQLPGVGLIVGDAPSEGKRAAEEEHLWPSFLEFGADLGAGAPGAIRS